MEEAIRNGTWVPGVGFGTGAGGAGRRARVDLGQKPGMWEVYLGEREKETGEKGLDGQNEKGPSPYGWEKGAVDWESMKPLYAAYVPSPVPAPLGLPAKVIPEDNVASVGGAVESRTRPGLVERARRAFGLRRREDGNETEMQPTQTTTTTQNAPNTTLPTTVAPNATPTINASRPPPTPNPATATPALPNLGAGAGEGADTARTMRVAVLIAMPRPPSRKTGHTPSPSTSTSASGASSPQPHPLAEPLASQPASTLAPPVEEEEEPLPVLEVGVAEVVLVRPEADGLLGEVGEGGDGFGRGKGSFGSLRDSASMSVEV